MILTKTSYNGYAKLRNIIMYEYYMWATNKELDIIIGMLIIWAIYLLLKPIYIEEIEDGIRRETRRVK